MDGAFRLEHWQGAQNHGTAVGKAVAGQQVSFDEVPWCWSDQYGQSLQVTGWTDGDIVVRGDVDGHGLRGLLRARAVCFAVPSHWGGLPTYAPHAR